ncbi:hypothetical protein [Nocardia jiangsuensis]|uniref:Conjugative transposon protein TcpC n=1 Tax=Nocardia jiangsuensis TaxID=1691563 RepID=A0ABV8E0Q9_9NOCA
MTAAPYAPSGLKRLSRMAHGVRPLRPIDELGFARQVLASVPYRSRTTGATPLSADVISEAGGIYKVNAHLTVNSTSVQNPDGAATTVTYSLTMDRNSGWQITEVGGLQNAIPAEGTR